MRSIFGQAGASSNALGAVYMTVGSLGYVINDALVRAATDEGLDVYQALCMRTATVTVFMAAGLRAGGTRISSIKLERPLVLRVVAEVTAAAIFFAALVQIDFAVAQTILMVVPFAVTLFAAVFLGEKVSLRQYGLVLLGFIGVLFVMQPATDSFSLWSIVVVVSAGGLVAREFATRKVDPSQPALVIALVTAAAGTVLTGLISVLTGWTSPSPRALLWLALACGFLIIGYLFTIQTVRVGELSVSAPFRYATLLGAVVIGLVAFDETPNTLTLVGCGVILAAGVATSLLDVRD